MDMFISGSSVFSVARSVLFRIARLSLSMVLWGEKRRFVFITPSCLVRQIVYDKGNKKTFRFVIRDRIDFFTAEQIYHHEDYGLAKLKRGSELLAVHDEIIAGGRSPLIIDCGGNIGLATRYFSQTYPGATILFVEPDPGNCRQARINNISENIFFFEAAIGCEDGVGDVVDPGLGANAYRISNTATGSTRIISMNKLLEQYPEDRFVPFIAKIDIEGFESDLFSRNNEWVDRFPLLIIELHDWMLPKTANSSNFLKTVSQLDRDFVYHEENVFSISNRLS